ncbi:hypothetical protein [Streptomyces sp. NPDC059564]|uniref:hypothetical protein n=1 Tax=Streptomyces sp. NPDC059564 TaxID=3346865 RepID=UPI003679C91C
MNSKGNGLLMLSPRSTPSRNRSIGTAAVLAVLTLGVSLLAGTATGNARAGAKSHLECGVRTLPGEPVTFSPEVTSTLRHVRVRGAVLLDRCTSPDGSQRHIRSGRLTLEGSADASCTRATKVRGTGTITWYTAAGARGEKWGTSRFEPGSGEAAYSPADTLFSGRVTSGRLAHQRATARILPSGAARQCGTRDLAAFHGSGIITFT